MFSRHTNGNKLHLEIDEWCLPVLFKFKFGWKFPLPPPPPYYHLIFHCNNPPTPEHSEVEYHNDQEYVNYPHGFANDIWRHNP